MSACCDLQRLFVIKNLALNMGIKSFIKFWIGEKEQTIWAKIFDSLSMLDPGDTLHL